VVGMAVAAFAVLFAGVVSPQAVAGSTAALLTFVLPVSEQAGASAIGDRLLGWALAGALCVPVALFVWAGRWHDPLRHALADAARAVADLLETGSAAGGVSAGRSDVDRALRALREQYEATPYRPTGAGPTDVALTNLVSRLEWAGSRARAATAQPPPPGERARVEAVEGAAAGVLRVVAELLVSADPGARPELATVLRASVVQLVAARDAASESVLASLAPGVGTPDVGTPGAGTVDASTDPASALAGVDPTYPVRMLAFALEMLADVALDTLGPEREGTGTVARWSVTLGSFVRVATGHLTPRSVWFRNSVRGAVALALAVLVVEVTTVEHGFWVVLGTLSVLRSNALGTGATAVRAVLGTAIGFLVGYVVLLTLGPHDAELWLLLPVAVLVAGIAPTVVSFTAGQAGFTVFVVLVFNVIEPVGSRIGLVRVEDVLIGAVVSVVVGALFWPRGAGSELVRALGGAYATAASWLAAAVADVGRTDDGTTTAAGARWTRERTAAMAAARRLDDAYRQYLGERGAKRMSLSVISRLVTGNARMRLTAVTLEGLPDLARPGAPPPPPEIAMARAGLSSECAAVQSWFDRFTASLGTGSPAVPPIPPVDDRLAPGLADAWKAARRKGRREDIVAVLRLLWVEERMADLRRLQVDLAGTVTGTSR
jgi:uncharacterized membrane protein YccC